MRLARSKARPRRRKAKMACRGGPAYVSKGNEMERIRWEKRAELRIVGEEHNGLSRIGAIDIRLNRQMGTVTQEVQVRIVTKGPDERKRC
jgi:predicted secreted protein